MCIALAKDLNLGSSTYIRHSQWPVIQLLWPDALVASLDTCAQVRIPPQRYTQIDILLKNGDFFTKK